MGGQRLPTKILRLFQNSLERRIKSDREELGLNQSEGITKSLMWFLMGTTAVSIVWLAFAKTDEVVVALGKLEPIGEVVTVQMPVNGVLQQMLVKDGQRVKKGQILMRLDNETTVDHEISIRKSIKDKEEQLRLKQSELDAYLTFNDTEQLNLVQNMSLEKRILESLERLRGSGATTEVQYYQQLNKVRDINGRLTLTKVDRLRQISILRQDIQQLRGELADLNRRLTELVVNIRYQDLRSPVDGLVFDLKPKGAGFVAQSSEPVMKIVPLSALQAKIEIESSDIGFVRVGKPVEISIDSFPSSDFGVLNGTLESIGSDALPPDELKNTYRYPATVRLNTQRFKLQNGKQLPLQAGMSLTANIKLRKVSYLQLLLGGFQDKAKSLREL